jgi:uncharacterized protein YjbJ (UPF0337 family)
MARMAEREQDSEQVAGGGLGKAVGRVKEAIGSTIGNDALAEEGRAQQVQADTAREAGERSEEAAAKEERADLTAERAQTEARREQLEGELARESQEDAIDGAEGSAVAAAQERAHEESMDAVHERRAGESAADAQERVARAREAVGLAEADRLRDEARQAGRGAAALDPEGEN